MKKAFVLGVFCALVILCGQARASYVLTNLVHPDYGDGSPVTANVVNVGLGVNVNTRVGEMLITTTPAVFGLDVLKGLCVNILAYWQNNQLNDLVPATTVFTPTVTNSLLLLEANVHPTDRITSAAKQLFAWQTIFPGTTLTPDGGTPASVIDAVLALAAQYAANLSTWTVSSDVSIYVFLPNPEGVSQPMLVVNTPEPGAIGITIFLLMCITVYFARSRSGAPQSAQAAA